MLNMHALNTLIAVAVVILTLSLVVQSIQAAIKKFLRLKSKQIEDSLIDLFEQVLDSRKAKSKPTFSAVPALSLRPGRSVKDATAEVRELYEQAMDRFDDLGRTVVTGKKALESLTKEDLSKVIATVEIEKILPGLGKKFEEACNSLTKVRAVFDEIQNSGLTGEAQLQWARLQSAVAPLLNDAAALFKEGKFTGSFVSDIVNFRNVKLDGVLDIIAAFRAQVANDAAAAPAGSSRQGDLNGILSRIDAVVKLLSTIPAKIDDAVAPIRARITAIDTWYDTVMQSFDERYSRSMKTWSIVIGFVVAVFFNASIFRVYTRISTDDALQTAIVSRAQTAVDKAQPDIEQNLKTINATAAGKNESKGNDAAAEKAAKDARENLAEIQNDVERQVSTAASTLSSFGFHPIWEDWNGITLLDGLGWFLMALLLSLGAPFWHDALSSLLGVKTLLEKKTETRTVEQLSGEGSTQST